MVTTHTHAHKYIWKLHKRERKEEQKSSNRKKTENKTARKRDKQTNIKLFKNGDSNPFLTAIALYVHGLKSPIKRNNRVAEQEKKKIQLYQ